MAVSVSDYIDAHGASIELGVSPDIEIENSKGDIDRGQDRMLEKALDMIHTN